MKLSHDAHHRTHDFLERETRSTETVIKACILAFPSIWVSCTTFYILLKDSPTFIFHVPDSMIALLLLSYIDSIYRLGLPSAFSSM